MEKIYNLYTLKNENNFEQKKNLFIYFVLEIPFNIKL